MLVPGSRPRDTVLVRSAWDEPSRLIAERDRGSYVIVRDEATGRALGCPKRLLFRFDANLFAGLRAAATAGDRQTLVKLWSNAEPWRGHDDDA